MNRCVLLLILMVLITPGLGGCIGFYTYKPIHVAVYDAETSQPIAGASVHVTYMYNMIPMLNNPSPTGATTDQLGRAKLDVAMHCPNRWPSLVASSTGYINGRPEWTVRNGTPHEPVNFYLYKEPPPQITFVVPDGYRGPLMIDMRSANTRVQDEPGKRNFTYEVSPSGYLKIDATPFLLDRFYLSKFVYKNGTGIPMQYEYGARNTIIMQELRVRVLTDHPRSGQHVFFLGTEHDAKDFANNPSALNALFGQSR